MKKKQVSTTVPGDYADMHIEPIVITGEQRLLTIIDEISESTDLTYINAAYAAIHGYLLDVECSISESVYLQIIAQLNDTINRLPTTPVRTALQRIVDLFDE